MDQPLLQHEPVIDFTRETSRTRLVEPGLNRFARGSPIIAWRCAPIRRCGQSFAQALVADEHRRKVILLYCAWFTNHWHRNWYLLPKLGSNGHASIAGGFFLRAQGLGLTQKRLLCSLRKTGTQQLHLWEPVYNNPGVRSCSRRTTRGTSLLQRQ
jgi:hypothetical protein